MTIESAQKAERSNAWRIGVDSGGTFTDVCLFDETSGRIAVWKVSSTPANPSEAVANGVREALIQIDAQAHDVFDLTIATDKPNITQQSAS